MHSKQKDKWQLLYNSDLSGEAILRESDKPYGKVLNEITFPAKLLRYVVNSTLMETFEKFLESMEDD